MSNGKKILVCGGRNYYDWERVKTTLDEYLWTITLLIEGGASGADCLAGSWAIERGIKHVTEFADWTRFGKSAGAIRNAKMLVNHEPDLVIAFPGGPGTADMIQRATKAGIEVIQK